jgi:GTP-binding protein
MLDVSSYRTLEDQFLTLKQEVENFSPNLAKREYAIALTRCDTKESKTINENTQEILDLIGFKEKLNIEKEECQFVIQDIYDRDKNMPFFVMPISSIAKINIDPLKYALADIVYENKK